MTRAAQRNHTLEGRKSSEIKGQGTSLCSSVVCYPCDVTLQKKKLNNWHLLSLFLCAQVHGWKLGFWLRQGSFSPVLWLLARFSSTPRHRGLSPGLLLPCAQDSVSGLLPEWGGREEGVQRRDWQQLNLFMTYSLKWHWHIFLIVHQFVDISLTPQYTPYKEFMHRKDRPFPSLRKLTVLIQANTRTQHTLSKHALVFDKCVKTCSIPLAITTGNVKRNQHRLLRMDKV